MKIRFKTMVTVLTLAFVLAAGSAQAATPIMNYGSSIENYSSFLEAYAYTDFQGCSDMSCTLDQIGVEMNVYENGSKIWNGIDYYFNGSAVVGTSGEIAVDSSKSYSSTTNHWAYGAFFSWSDTTYDSM